MAITDLCTNVTTNVTSSNEFIRVPLDAFNEIEDALEEPSHLFAELYTLRYNETIMIYDVANRDGVNVLRVQRGMGGTEARAWPDGACLRITRQVDGRPCGADGEDDVSSDLLRALLAMLTIGRGLELIDGATGPVLRLASTGAVAGTYGGAEVNATGQFTHLPSGWPASAVPAFEVCCDDTGGGGEVPDGLVLSIEGIQPDGTGNVRLCPNTASDVPVTANTPVFICQGGNMAKTTVGRILSLVPPPEDIDLDGYVQSVGGLTPDGAGAIDTQDAAVITSLTNATVLVSTPGGLRRTTVGNLLGEVTISTDVDMTFNPATGEFTITVNGTEATQSLRPAVQLEVNNGNITVTVAGASATAELPASATITNELEVNLNTGALTSTVGGTEATVILPIVSAIPVEGTAPGGLLYKLIRTASGEFYFVPDT